MKNILIAVLMLTSLGLFGQKRIMIDPGHGYTSGSPSRGNPDGRSSTEINTNFEVANKLHARLKYCPHLTSNLTTTGRVWITIGTRYTKSNNYRADRFLSIHCNAGGGTGTETIYYSGTSSTGRTYCQHIQNNMVYYGQWRDRRIKSDYSIRGYNFGVLKYTRCFAGLNEIGFVDYSSDARKLNSNWWRDRFAYALQKGLETNQGSCSSKMEDVPNGTPGSFEAYVSGGCKEDNNYNKLIWTESPGATSYKIYRNGQYYATSTGLSFMNYTIGEEGNRNTYRVEAVNDFGSTSNTNGEVWSASQSCSAIGGKTTDINTTDNRLTISPNPAVNNISLQFVSVNDTKYKVEVYNLQGQVVMENSSEGSPNEMVSTNLDISSLPSGSYMIRLISSDKVLSEKFIKE